MDPLGILFFLYVLVALAAGAVGAVLLLRHRFGRHRPPGTRRRGHLLLGPLYLLLLVAAGVSLWGWYTAATDYTPARAELVGQYEADRENSDANVDSKIFLRLNADSTYVLAGDLLQPSQGRWARPGPANAPFAPALALSRPDDFFQVVVIRQAHGFHLGIQGRDPDDPSVLALKKVR